MKVWVLTEIHDDSDPCDRANIVKVRVFGDLRLARAALLAEPYIHVDNRADFLFEDGITEDDCRAEPELYTWVTGAAGPDDSWSGGYIYELTEVEVEQ